MHILRFVVSSAVVLLGFAIAAWIIAGRLLPVIGATVLAGATIQAGYVLAVAFSARHWRRRARLPIARRVPRPRCSGTPDGSPPSALGPATSREA